MKFYIAKVKGVTELLACEGLPGPGTDPVRGLTYRAILPEDLLEWPESVQLYSGCWQSYPSESYTEIDLVTFRRTKARIQNGFDLQWHYVSQTVFPEIWMGFEHYNRPKKDQTPQQDAA